MVIFHSYATDLMCHQGYENDGGLNPEEQLAVVWAQWAGHGRDQKDCFSTNPMNEKHDCNDGCWMMAQILNKTALNQSGFWYRK
jgi:hypothetical protein